MNDQANRPPIEIRAVEAIDEMQWRVLWADYLRFYRARLNPAVTETTWARLNEPHSGIQAIVAVVDGSIIGFAHLVYQQTTWSVARSCYLHDLFVAETHRGIGTARALITQAATLATEAGCDRLHWLTQEYNSDARALYDALATRTSFVQYVRKL